METSSKEKVQPRSRSASPDRLSNGKQRENRSRSKSRYSNRFEGNENITYTPYREQRARGRCNCHWYPCWNTV